MSDIKEIFYNKFKQYFDEGKWSEQRFADAAKINPSSVHHYLTRASSPTLENLAKIAAVFRVSIGDLTEEENPVKKKIKELRVRLSQLEIDRLKTSEEKRSILAAMKDDPFLGPNEEDYAAREKYLVTIESDIAKVENQINTLTIKFPDFVPAAIPGSIISYEIAHYIAQEVSYTLKKEFDIKPKVTAKK